MGTITKAIGTAVGSVGTGTVTAAASTAVVGVGTLFNTEMKDGSGYPLTFQVSGTLYNVASITDDTHLTLTVAATFTGSAYTRGSRNYSTVQAWEDALPANLVTDGNSQVGQCYNDSEFLGTTARLVISGETTDSTHTITLNCGTGQSFRDNANAQTNALRYNQSNGVGIRSSASNSICVTVSANYVTLDGLQISGGDMGLSIGGTNTVVQNCIVESLCQYSGPNVIEINSNPTKIINSLAIMRKAGFNGINNGAGSGTSTLANLTVVKPTDFTANNSAISTTTGGTTNVTNCAGFGFGSFSSGSGTFTGSNNCSDKTIGFGTSNQASKTYANQFVNTTDATRDYRIKTGADCVDTGATDTTDIPSATDIVKTSRPQGSAWDVGAWELVQAAAGFAHSFGTVFG